MGLTANALWAIYIIVAVAAFIILWIVFALASRCNKCSTMGVGAAFLWATILAGLAVFIANFWVDPNEVSSGEGVSLAVLYLVAFVLPVFTGLIMIWTNGGFSWRSCTCKKACKPDCQKKCCRKPDPCKKPDPCEKKVDPCDPCARSTGYGHRGY